MDNELNHVNRVGRLKHASVSMGNRKFTESGLNRPNHTETWHSLFIRIMYIMLNCICL
uniref:tetracycline resistance efflux system leader peptide n=1 Tax=Pseudomonas syringae group genomosp. 3 TaxID=251701 RepID=UPI0035C7F76F